MENFPETCLEQSIKGSKKISNYVVASMLTIGGTGFLLASGSSYFGKDLLPMGSPSTLIFVPQGLIMGLYGIVGSLMAIYLWSLVRVDFGSGFNSFDKNKGVLIISRRGFFKELVVEIPLKDIQAVKMEIKDGFNAKRRICLKLRGRKDLPISGGSQPRPLLELEQEGAELARFLEVNLEGLTT
ncbi:photosystem I assembly protein Ycf4 [Prochlorococcus marinus]|uniref:Photosystem I assembly protein Ycf4 n=1 Tax=Prochlorococcus marinus (strain MIT 9211) TaxID=93059 RepID=A9BBF1_PROM4|nr:photosystem I assembly protein Ycf4 [Prochlorococcus marinus]ABX09163.1 photosystem I assembly related protein Ycf4 [Prochlorococcus marinus str. MIT 9211]